MLSFAMKNSGSTWVRISFETFIPIGSIEESAEDGGSMRQIGFSHLCQFLSIEAERRSCKIFFKRGSCCVKGRCPLSGYFELKTSIRLFKQLPSLYWIKQKWLFSISDRWISLMGGNRRGNTRLEIPLNDNAYVYLNYLFILNEQLFRQDIF